MFAECCTRWQWAILFAYFAIVCCYNLLKKKKASWSLEKQKVCLQLHLEDDPASRMARQLSGMTALPAARPQLWETFQHDRPSWVRIPTSRWWSTCHQSLNLEANYIILEGKILYKGWVSKLNACRLTQCLPFWAGVSADVAKCPTLSLENKMAKYCMIHYSPASDDKIRQGVAGRPIWGQDWRQVDKKGRRHLSHLLSQQVNHDAADTGLCLKFVWIIIVWQNQHHLKTHSAKGTVQSS